MQQAVQHTEQSPTLTRFLYADHQGGEELGCRLALPVVQVLGILRSQTAQRAARHGRLQGLSAAMPPVSNTVVQRHTMLLLASFVA